MASSSLVDSSWNSPTSFSIRYKYCYCHRKASIKISESRRNPNKLYFGCSNCKFFQWFEGPEEGEVSSQRTDQRSSMQKEDQVQFTKVEQSNSIVKWLLIMNLLFIAIYVFMLIFFQWFEGPEDGEVSSQRAERHSIMQREDQVQIGNVDQSNSIVKWLLIMNLVFLAIYVFMLIVKEIKWDVVYNSKELDSSMY